MKKSIYAEIDEEYDVVPDTIDEQTEYKHIITAHTTMFCRNCHMLLARTKKGDRRCQKCESECFQETEEKKHKRHKNGRWK